LLKDMYATERKRAKTLNFSIAYGKTAVGLSRDWGVSLNEAKDTLRRWCVHAPTLLPHLSHSALRQALNEKNETEQVRGQA